MKGIEIPPRTEDFTADPVELFFDLAYVFAFSQLVGHLVHHPDWEGVGEAALLFILMWLAWSQFTWAANRVSGNGRTVRVLFLIGTAVSLPMAASVSTAYEAGGAVFSISLAIIVLLGLTTITLGFEKGTEEFTVLVRWMWPSLLGLAVIVAGGLAEDRVRIVLWLAGVAIIFMAMIAAGRGEWVVRPGHMAERHGLIIIIALGEVVVAIGLPVVNALEAGVGLPAATVTALLASGSLAGLLWWGYFDRPSPALEYAAERIDDRVEAGRYVRDVYTWCHALIVAGVIVTAAALEEIALHPNDAVSGTFRFMLFGGLSLFFGGVAIAVFRAFRLIARERLVAAGVVGVVLLVASDLAGMYLIVCLVVVVLLMLVAEQIRVEGSLRPDHSAVAPRD